MARKCEVSFKIPSSNDMNCCLYHLPSYRFIRNADFDNIYKIATKTQRIKLKSLEKNRYIEICLHLNVADISNI